MSDLTTDQIRQRFAEERQKGRRARDAAHAIGLSVGAAVAAHVGTPEARVSTYPSVPAASRVGVPLLPP